MLVLPDLRKAQLDSFCSFLTSNLPTEIGQFKPIEAVNSFTGQSLRFELLSSAYKLVSPGLSDREAIHTFRSYVFELYVPARLVDKDTGTFREKTLWIGSIPLPDTNGTFVINGVPRCVVNQLLRAPGIYYRSRSNRTQAATIVFNTGIRLGLELDRRGHLSARVSRDFRIPVKVLLQWMGMKTRDIPYHITSDAGVISKLSRGQNTKSELKRLRAWARVLAGHPHRAKRLRKKPPQLLVDKRPWQRVVEDHYDLGLTGRRNINRTLHAHRPGSPPKGPGLHYLDILAAGERLLQAKKPRHHIDEIDELTNKRVKSVGTLMHEELRMALEDLGAQVRRRIRHSRSVSPTSLRKMIGGTVLIASFSQLFTSHTLSQFLDQSNPLAGLVHKRKLSALGPGGLTPRTATFRARDIYPSQYGRVCPVETAEGQNAGIVTSLTVCANIDDSGEIRTPLLAAHGSFLRKPRTALLSANEDKHCKVATGSSLAIAQNSCDGTVAPVQHRREAVSMFWSQVQLRGILPVHSFAVGVTLIPFLEHDDATRALMGSNMQRQAVVLVSPSKPIVGTGFEAQVALDSGATTTAAQDGKVRYVDGQRILQLNRDHSQSERGLLVFERSNQKTCVHQRPAAQIGQLVRRGQLLAEGAASAGGELALGKNVLVAYMPWEGYNFEDAVLISERLVYDDVYTSLHIDRHEAEVRETVEGREIITRKIPGVNRHLLRHLDSEGIVALGSWVEPGDVLIGRLSPISGQVADPNPETKLLRAIFGLASTHSKETSLRVPPRGGGRVIDVRVATIADEEDDTLEGHGSVSGDPELDRVITRIYILQRRRIQVGDKVAGRHGNKGVVSRILPRQEMPYLQDGTPVDMVLSPLGVPSRMNVGQVLECLLGLAGEHLGKHYRVMPFDETHEPEASRKLVLSELYCASQAAVTPWLFERTSPGKTALFDGRTGDMFVQPVTVGRAYVLKLIHQVDEKIHARSTGPYALVTQQPLRGRAKQGGQRVGEMEVWALQGLGAAHVLQEMLLTKSDHVVARFETLGAIVAGGLVPRAKGAQDSLRLLVRELRCLGIHTKHCVLDERGLIAGSTDV